ncbi:hypothetical protein IFM89_000745 [Coptis chinensis]|uniref:Uncharacterized protein n=1 Tax=Coptis chinensis TaxID=261450 RepID=A0A835IT98_9MAGN|nr:hypothetical protein IFM89_000745 [Coptis chinensis]
MQVDVVNVISTPDKLHLQPDKAEQESIESDKVDIIKPQAVIVEQGSAAMTIIEDVSTDPDKAVGIGGVLENNGEKEPVEESLTTACTIDKSEDKQQAISEAGLLLNILYNLGKGSLDTGQALEQSSPKQKVNWVDMDDNVDEDMDEYAWLAKTKKKFKSISQIQNNPPPKTRAKSAVKGIQKGGLTPRSAAMGDFRHAIDQNELMEPPNTGCKFTWWNKQLWVNKVMGKLDRMLVNVDLNTVHASWKYKVLGRIFSDHSPLVGWCITIPKPRNAPFKFHNMWASHPGFLTVVEES